MLTEFGRAVLVSCAIMLALMAWGLHVEMRERTLIEEQDR
jgi:hypothetical protein